MRISLFLAYFRKVSDSGGKWEMSRLLFSTTFSRGPGPPITLLSEDSKYKVGILNAVVASLTLIDMVSYKVGFGNFRFL